MKMRIAGSPPVMAIYEEGADDAPFTSPMSNLSRVRLHSSVPYLGVVSMTTGSLVPSSGISTTVTVGTGLFARSYRRTNLFAHGLSYAPLIVGTITTTAGTMPVMCPPYGIEVVADGTYVYLSYLGGTDIAGTVSYNIGCTNYGVDGSGAFVTQTSFNGARITPSRIQCGFFDTNNRYLQRDTGGSIPIVIGESMSMGLGVSNSGFDDDTVGMELIYNVNGVVVHTASHRVLRTGLPEVNASFAATVVVCSA